MADGACRMQKADQPGSAGPSSRSPGSDGGRRAAARVHPEGGKTSEKKREGEKASGSDDENRASTPGTEKRRQKSPLANRLRAGGRAARVWEASGTTKDTHLDWGVSTRRIWPSRSPWRVTTCATETVR